MHGLQSIFKFEQCAERELERVLVGMVNGADGEVEERRAALLNVIAQDLGYGLAFEEGDETLGAGLVGGEIGYVEAAGIEVVAGEHDAGLSVVEGNGVFVVAGDGYDIQHAAAEV